MNSSQIRRRRRVRVVKKNLNRSVTRHYNRSGRTGQGVANSSLVQQSLKSNNRALAKALEQGRRDLHQLRNSYTELQHENQELVIKVTTLERIVGMDYDVLDEIINERISVIQRNAKLVIRKIGSSLLTAADELQELERVCVKNSRDSTSSTTSRQRPSTASSEDSRSLGGRLPSDGPQISIYGQNHKPCPLPSYVTARKVNPVLSKHDAGRKGDDASTCRPKQHGDGCKEEARRIFTSSGPVQRTPTVNTVHQRVAVKPSDIAVPVIVFESTEDSFATGEPLRGVSSGRLQAVVDVDETSDGRSVMKPPAAAHVTNPDADSTLAKTMLPRDPASPLSSATLPPDPASPLSSAMLPPDPALLLSSAKLPPPAGSPSSPATPLLPAMLPSPAGSPSLLATLPSPPLGASETLCMAEDMNLTVTFDRTIIYDPLSDERVEAPVAPPTGRDVKKKRRSRRKKSRISLTPDIHSPSMTSQPLPCDDEVAETSHPTRLRRRRTAINYKEPSTMIKMRQGDAHTDTFSLQLYNPASKRRSKKSMASQPK
ncbi:PREDICTED: uncharacterized protein PB18E9.04c-like [Priapulus caudatus]|uniref:Uncharacterized protein PB18E9.04c-like n=1 Tax=Priapulus caudatus TaxID=37621 RepID=A0ABM1DYG6_PRICU|nr:PREDICTED: uncharacterized protein PB18E9.04c-like [Priapulus caudatus]